MFWQNSIICGMALCLVAASGLTTTCVAQDSGLFNGSGIRLGSSNDESTRPKMIDWSKLNPNQETERPKFQFPKFTMPKWNPPKLQMPKLFQGENYPKPVNMSDEPGMFSNMPKFSDWFPKRDPSKPNFFERMNTRSREFWERTRENFSSANEDFKSRTRDSWDNITRNITPAASETRPPAQPPLRSAQRTDAPAKRF